MRNRYLDEEKKIIVFPKKNKRNPELKSFIAENEIDVELKKIDLQVKYIDQITPLVVAQLINVIKGQGIYFPNNDETRFDSSLMIESIRSALFRIYALPHPLQKFAKDMFENQYSKFIKAEEPTSSKDPDPPAPTYA